MVVAGRGLGARPTGGCLAAMAARFCSACQCATQFPESFDRASAFPRGDSITYGSNGNCDCCSNYNNVTNRNGVAGCGCAVAIATGFEADHSRGGYQARAVA